MEPLRSPLHDRHRDRGAKLAEFGGWEMPLEYSGGGVLAEHAAVREAVGLFDVSHLGKAVVRGSGAADFVNRCLTNDLERIGPGQAQYTLCCTDDGGTVDDMVVYLRSDFEVLVVPNAANAAEVIRRLDEAAPEGVEVVDRHRELAVLAVQGPLSDETLGSLAVRTDHDYMSFAEGEIAGHEVLVCRSGYTGERGYELITAAETAGDVWDAVLAAGAEQGIRPCGLGARDTLRTEMGYPLHGHELSAAISPVMARAGWAVGWSKPEFWGKEALERQRAEKSGPLLRGLLAEGRGIPRPEMLVRSDDGRELGTVTSGTFSPTRRQGIGLALLDRSVGDGQRVHVDVRGRRQAFTVAKPPFVDVATKPS